MPATISINRAPVLTLGANVVDLLAERLGIDASSIAVVSGHGSPAKVVAVDGMDDDAIWAPHPREKPKKAAAQGPGNKRVTRSGKSLIPA